MLNIGHHLTLPKSNLKYCFHALAIDERRLSFLPTRLPGACEVWFRGVHSDIGGGNGNRGLNDISLNWMISKAKAAGLPITDADIAALAPSVVRTATGAEAAGIGARGIVSRSAASHRHADWKVGPLRLHLPGGNSGRRAERLGSRAPPASCCGSPEVRRRMSAMWDAADTVAKQTRFRSRARACVAAHAHSKDGWSW